MKRNDKILIRPLEKEDLLFVHRLDNNANVMRYWFEEPYVSLVELTDLYQKHIHDQSERRFIIESTPCHKMKNTSVEIASSYKVGLIELVEINYIHRRGELQILIDPHHQGNGYGEQAVLQAMEYAFRVLNLHKLYLIVDAYNEKAIYIYQKCGFVKEAVLRQEFFANGKYRDVIRMCIFQKKFFTQFKIRYSERVENESKTEPLKGL